MIKWSSFFVHKGGWGGVVGFFLMVCGFGYGMVSCDGSGTTPKPKGYYRIDLPEIHYTGFSLDELPYSFNVSRLVRVELPPSDTSGNWINLAYPALNAKIYCSFHQMGPADLPVLEKECRELVSRNARHADAITEQAFENQDLQVYGMLFKIDGETASPVQFLLTDSTTRFFRGALYYECKPNVDSLAPVTSYLNEHVMELIHTFRWKHTPKHLHR
ncbi:MAG: gliding motility protein GldD [Tannerella sp.]|jgi:gliding motility-associated lipoprotein GldD|nr:gliding motility protein GldD [Tannerella sp.]